MSFKRAIAGVLTIGFMIASATSLPSPSYAQDAKVKTAMDTLQSKAEKLGPAKVEGTDTVSGKQVPAIYFGSTKQNNNFALVDDVANETGGIATIRQLKQEKVRRDSGLGLSLCIRNEVLPEPLAGETRHLVKRTWLFEEVRRARDDHELLFTAQ